MPRLTGLPHSLLLGILTIVFVVQVPLRGYTEELKAQPDQASIPELELIKEEETVSIASRYEQPISKAPSNVYVITDEDIRQSGATDIPTILRRVPGMEVMQMSGADFNVSVRGNNQVFANKLLVLVDGRSIYVDVQGTVFWKAIPVTLPEIKRIEVLRGPASAVYGFNAFDGVVNIITKSPEEMKGTTLQFGGGELGTISSAAINAGKTDKFGYRLSIGRDQNNQWRDRDALAFRSNKINLQTEYDLPNDSKLGVSLGYINVDRFDGGIGSSSSLNTPFTQGYANVAYERRNFFVRGWWSRWDTSADFNTVPRLAPFFQLTDAGGRSQDVRFLGNTYNVEGQHTLELGQSYRLTYGLNYRLNTLSSASLLGYSREDRLGLYLQGEWDVTSKVKIMASARYDMDTFINPTVSPRGTILYTPVEDHTFHLSASAGYRPPTIFQEQTNQLVVITPPAPIPSPPPTEAKGSHNLQPEQIISYEAGYQGWLFNHRLRLRTDLFLNHISNVIFHGNDPGDADIYGGEAGVEFLASKWLTGFANYSYQEISQTFTDEARRGGPRFKWNMGLRGEWDNGLSGEAGFHHYGAATYPISPVFSMFAAIPGSGVTVPNPYVGSYNLLNIRTGYKFWQQKAEAGYMRDAEVAISAFNALNDNHKEHPLGDTIGSRVMGWLTVRY